MADGILAQCPICGGTIQPRHKFCGSACYHEAQRRGMVKVGHDFTRNDDCAHCGGLVHRTPSRKRNGEKSDKVFCSRDCYHAFRSAVIAARIKPCKNCGKPVGGPTVSPKKLYCSMECRKQGMRNGPTHCVSCGVWFTPVTFARGFCTTPGKTCSRECQIDWIKNNQERKGKISIAFTGSNHPAWKGGASLWNNVGGRGPNWQAQRAKALKRDKDRCVDCGITGEECKVKYKRGLDVDHVVPFHNFTNYRKANALSNLECRCASCHHKAESKRRMTQMMLPIQTSRNRQHKGYRAGERHPRAKLTRIDVMRIRSMTKRGSRGVDLAAQFSVSRSAIWAIVKGKVWKC